MNFEPDAMIASKAAKIMFLIAENRNLWILICVLSHFETQHATYLPKRFISAITQSTQKKPQPEGHGSCFQPQCDYLLNRSLIPPNEPSTLVAS